MVTRTPITSSVGRETVQSVAKILLAAASLLFVAYLLTLLPGVGGVIPRTPITVVALIGAFVSLVVVALLVVAAPKLAQLTRMSLSGPVAVVENLASLVYWLVVLAAVLVAHRGLAAAVEPLLDGTAWAYDLFFLLAALPAVAIIAARLYATLDPAAELFADSVTEGDSTTDE